MKIRINKLKIFEAYVLRILSIQFTLTGISYLIYKQWWIGIIVIIISFLFGTIGQGLKHNRQRSAKDLIKGQDWNITEQGEEDGLTTEERHLIARPFFFTCWIVIITSVIILFHHDFRWYTALLLGLVTGIFYPLILFFLGIFWTRLTTKKNQ